MDTKEIPRNKFKFKGCNDDHDTCDCCGKTGLKKVVWLVELNEHNEEMGSPAPYGTTCAGKLMGIPGTRAKLTSKFKSLDYEMKREEHNRLSTLISKKRHELAIAHGLIGIEGFWIFPEDTDTVKRSIGMDRIRAIQRPAHEISPIFGFYGKPEQFLQYL